MKKNQILKIYGTDFKKNTIRLLETADLKAHLSGTDQRIGIKPNLVSESEASYGATTHPEIIAGIIEYLQTYGYHNLTILEGSWVGSKTADAFAICGYNDLAEKYGVRLVDTQKDSSHKKDCAGMQLSVCDSVDEIEFLINVPVLKGHCQTKMTCALKNLKGLIPNSEKRRFHSLGLHKPIAHLAAGIRQDFIVVDHICGDLDFEDGGNPVVRNWILAGRDPVLIDAWVCRELKYRPKDVPYLTMAEKLGVGSLDLDNAQIINLSDTDTGELPLSRKVVLVEDAVEEVESCSACYGYLIPALDRLREEGLLDAFTEKICIGQGFRGKSGAIGIGNCTKNFEYYVPGCPPTESEIYEGLKEYLGKKQ